MKKISIVIPVYNEEKFIAQTMEKVIRCDSCGFKKEIILIDDGSKDQSPKLLKALLTKYRKQAEIKLILNKHNRGKGAALKDGFLNSTGDIVLVQDADLEYNPDEYPILLEPFIKHNAEVVYGSRLLSNRPHRVLYFWHYVSNLFLTTLSNMFTNLNLSDMETGYKVFRGDLIRDLAKKLESKRFGIEPEITARIAKIKGLKIYEVGISYSGRTYEEGKKIGWKDGARAIWEIFKYNVLR